ncbi:MAG: type II toxin-antitoxin system RelE/ParE family toxin [Fermentimonas sp.]|nr:type II toxin-antitoxin system RelE/ParE family toxin [Fermentimonas sp.]
MLSIIWSNRAIAEFEDILRYWVRHNGTVTYSVKVEAETEKALALISKNSLIGVKVKNRVNVRRLMG